MVGFGEAWETFAARGEDFFEPHGREEREPEHGSGNG